MDDGAAPLFVYERIDANRRQTRYLLAMFPIVLAPLVCAISLIVATTPFVRFATFFLQPAWVVAATIALTTFSFVVAASQLVARYAEGALVRLAGATRIDSQSEPELFRVVENLCIGAGLPMPRIYVARSGAPNAFATGTSPQHAALVVTRGLLDLLNRRELEGVIAHELSHIGNNDIRLSTTVAALVSIAMVPFTIIRFLCLSMIDDDLELTDDQRAFCRRVSLWFSTSGMFAGTVGIDPLAAWLRRGWFGIAHLSALDPIWVWILCVTSAPIYVIFVAPVLAQMIRYAWSQEREFLADADAVRLTRDPEGLAIALVKVGAAGGRRLLVNEGCAHLYFADPTSASFMRWIFPTHPPLQDRIDLLARMGNGLDAETVNEARAAAGRVHDIEPVDPGFPSEVLLPSSTAAMHDANPDGWVDDPTTPVYERADGWSRVVARLPANAAITRVGSEGRFIRVVTTDNVTGYVAASDLPALTPSR